MAESSQRKRIVFAPGVLEQMEQEMTPEELQAALDEIELLANGSNQGVEVDMGKLLLEDPVLYKTLTDNLEAVKTAEQPTLQ